MSTMHTPRQFSTDRDRARRRRMALPLVWRGMVRAAAVLVLELVAAGVVYGQERASGPLLEELERLAAGPAAPVVIVGPSRGRQAPPPAPDVLEGLRARQYQARPGPWPPGPSVVFANSSRVLDLPLLPPTPAAPWYGPDWSDPWYWPGLLAGALLPQTPTRFHRVTDLDRKQLPALTGRPLERRRIETSGAGAARKSR